MAKPGRLQKGQPLKIKGAEIEFSYFPAAKTVRRAGLRSKAYTTDAWSVILACVRRIKPKPIRISAVAFAEQSHEFFSAALANTTVRAKPLLLYYAFLNLTKALCLHLGNDSVVGEAKHGLRASKNGPLNYGGDASTSSHSQWS